MITSVLSAFVFTVIAGVVQPTPPRIPPPIPHTNVLNPFNIYNQLLSPPPPQAVTANKVADASSEKQSSPGRGIKQTETALAKGLALYPVADACIDFNTGNRWASSTERKQGNVWSDWYAAWGPYAEDDGVHQARNVTFSLERSVGPGNKYGAGQFASKIASNQPYIAGYLSPIIKVKAGATVKVAANYLLYDHDTSSMDYDWAALGVAPNGNAAPAEWETGYVRGEWAEISHTLTAGANGEILVFLQAESPGALNSNIYFDNVRVWVDGVLVTDSAS